MKKGTAMAMTIRTPTMRAKIFSSFIDGYLLAKWSN
jgi:hypothetical protein